MPDEAHDWSTGAPQYIRPLALVLVRRDDGAILAAPGFDHVKKQRFYRPLGGGIEFGERAEDAARRELQRRARSGADGPAAPGHVREPVHLPGPAGPRADLALRARFTDRALYERDVVIADEGGSKFEVHWVPFETFQRGEAPLYPDGLFDL